MAKTRDSKPAKRRGESLARAMEVWKRNAASREYAMDSFKVIFATGVTRQEYLEGFLAMEEKYPGRGWKEEMNNLERFYHEHGFQLRHKPIIADLDLENVVMQ